MGIIVAALLAAAIAAPVAPSCLPESVNVSNVSPFHPTKEQLEQIAAGPRAPTVVGLRKALDAYNTGRADRETRASLKAIDADHIRGRFAVLSNDASPMGGEFLEIAFPRHLDRIYLAWMYRYANGTWVVRSFRPMPCTAQQLHWIQARYGELFNSPSATI